MASQAPSSRPVHPCVSSVFRQSCGAEYSCWAWLTESAFPNLVTSQNSSLSIYTLDPDSGKLAIEASFSDLCGSVCCLIALPNEKNGQKDALLLGFAGHPRLAVVTYTKRSLQSSCLLDFTPALTDYCAGAVTPLEQDLVASVVTRGSTCTLATILGGGVAVATTTVQRLVDGTWHAQEPFVLPLSLLNKSVEGANTSSASKGTSGTYISTLSQSIGHGFGDILDICFLEGFNEPTVVLLHSRHRGWSGRLGRTSSGTRTPMALTAISITVSHCRAAVLWSMSNLPSDAISLVTHDRLGCVVLCVNSLVHVTNSGQLTSALAVNGWAHTTLPYSLATVMQANPYPLPKLAVQLDGAQLVFLSKTVALVALRSGQFYSLEQHELSTWSMTPIGMSLGAIGQVASVAALPLSTLPTGLFKDVELASKEVSVGLAFCSSRVGDSSLLGYAVQKVVIKGNENGGKPESNAISITMAPDEEANQPPTKRMKPSDNDDKTHHLDDDESILQLEEDALYAPTEIISVNNNCTPDVAYDDEKNGTGKSSSPATRLRKITSLSVFTSVQAMDSLTVLGPLGPGCNGVVNNVAAHVMPCGYGSSGGLTILSTPGSHNILAETDCRNVDVVFCMPETGLVLMGMRNVGGVSVLRYEQDTGGKELKEVDLNEWVESNVPSFGSELYNPIKALTATQLRSALEWGSDIILVVETTSNSSAASLSPSLVVLSSNDRVRTEFVHPLNDTGKALVSITPLHRHSNAEKLSFGCIWSSGQAVVITLKKTVNGYATEWSVVESVVTCNKLENAPVKTSKKDEEGDTIGFYESDRVVAMDVFEWPIALLTSGADFDPVDSADATECDQINMGREEDWSEEDLELYQIEGGEIGSKENSKTTEESGLSHPGVHPKTVACVAICRQSGLLQLFELNSIEAQGLAAVPFWESHGCGHGVARLEPVKIGTSHQLPRMHRVHATEIRFFATGPTIADDLPGASSLFRSYNLLVDNNLGDLSFYRVNNGLHTSFLRSSLPMTTRRSKEEEKHCTKLKRKEILVEESVLSPFRYNALHRFKNVSGEDGLFAASSRPLWFVSERGLPTVLYHRMRHAAPAGGKPLPVTSFCSSMPLKPRVEEKGGLQGAGFITLHERIGRIGSQRMTLFSGLSHALHSHGLLPGGGMCAQKIPLGVTVRKIVYIDDDAVSSDERPLYVLLVSKELESDQSHLKDNKLSPEELQKIKEGKEAERTRKQVEADLSGGFEFESEWVEEIEREDCFELELSLGGAPPIPKSTYAVWLVDAQSWDIVDSVELNEYEYGLTMEVMLLSSVAETPGSSTSEVVDNNLHPKNLFVAVGTGVVDQDGEDVGSKGRVLLLSVARQAGASTDARGPVADLTLVYEKDILHGPVTSLSLLTSDGRNRIVIGAGADVNVEQWGNDRLTQVGFFRAQMHIETISLFKNFFLLSDAYDSLYFLVWRESDKSLTLLAKDYEPVAVYAAGWISRGGNMSFVCHDDRQNLQFFQYAPGDPAARGGNKLVCRSDIHSGSVTVGFRSHWCRSSLIINSATPSSTLAALKQQDPLFGRGDDDQRFALHFGDSDGGFGSVVPLSEQIYWRLAALQSVIGNVVESSCSLNHKAWRLYRRTPRRGGCRSNDRKKGVIDGDVVMRFCDLSITEQEDVSNAIGTTVSLILDNLLELKCSTMIV